MATPAVVECAVIGVPADDEAGEDEVLAVVVPPTRPARCERDQRRQADLPDFAIPRFLRVVDALPKTPSEKVRKAVLRDDGVTGDTYDNRERLRPLMDYTSDPVHEDIRKVTIRRTGCGTRARC